MSWSSSGSASRRHLSRRTLLRGALASGTSVAVGLPLLEAMVGDHGEALADGSPLPRRFGVYYWGNGVVHEAWVPRRTGFDWELPHSLQPFDLADPELRHYLTLLTGFNHAPVDPPHIPAHGVALSASHAVQWTEHEDEGYRGRNYPEPTLDVIVRDAWLGQTAEEAIHVAITRADPHFGDISWEPGGRAVNQPFSSPEMLYDQVFGAGHATASSDTPLSQLTRQLEGSMLDAIRADAARLRRELPCYDRNRLDQHLDNLRAIERRLHNLQPLPPTCGLEPGVVIDDSMLERSRVTAELLANALACDATRVFTYEWSSHQSEFRYQELGINLTHHNDISHALDERRDEFRSIMQLVMGGLAHLAELLRQTPELDGNVLDNTLVLATSEHANGNRHDLYDHPLLLVGRGGGTVASGQHFRHPRPDQNHDAPKVLLTALRAVGVDVEGVGMRETHDSRGQPLPSRHATETVTEVLT